MALGPGEADCIGAATRNPANANFHHCEKIGPSWTKVPSLSLGEAREHLLVTEDVVPLRRSRISVSQALERIRHVSPLNARWEPYAGKPHVRIWAGARGNSRPYRERLTLPRGMSPELA